MKQSRNNIVIPKSNGDYIIANTLTRSVIELNPMAMSELKQGDVTQLKELTKDNFNELIDMGFLVPNDLNEDNFMNFILQKERISSNTLLTYLMYSTACNFDCQYCYEKGNFDKTMDQNTVANLISWYSYRLKNSSYKECHVVLFGGEPLLFSDFFENFLQKIDVIAKENEVLLTSEIITNGYLLTNEVVKKFIPFNFKEIQVTLDGPPELHNALRPLKEKTDGTFYVILDNLLKISTSFGNIEFLCRISFNKSNVQFIPKLLDILKEKDPLHKIIPYFAHTTQTYSQFSEKNSFCSQNVFSDDVELADCYIFLYKEAKKRGFVIPSFLTLGPCMFYSANGFVITPNGYLYKCLDMVGVEELSIGNINSPTYYTSKFYEMMNINKVGNCLKTDCPFVPICGSSCVIEPWLKYNDCDKICCRRNMLERIHNALLVEKFSD